MVAWQSGHDGALTGVVGQRYDSAGQVAGAEFQINSHVPGYQGFPAVAPGLPTVDSRAWFRVAWHAQFGRSRSARGGLRSTRRRGVPDQHLHDDNQLSVPSGGTLWPRMQTATSSWCGGARSRTVTAGSSASAMTVRGMAGTEFRVNTFTPN